MAELQKDELEVYDRQLRLWGFEVQKKLKSAKVLLVNIRAYNSELARHLIFSGISVALLDEALPERDEKWSNFLLSQASPGDTRAKVACACLREMNSFVGIEPVSTVDSLTGYNAVVLDSENLKEISLWSEKCKHYNIPLYVLIPAGLNAFVFVVSKEAGEFTLEQYLEKAKNIPEPTGMPKQKKKQWAQPLLHAFLCKFLGMETKAHYEKIAAGFLVGQKLEDLEKMVNSIGIEFNPVASVIGALVGQQIGQYVAQAQGYEKMTGLTVYDSCKEFSISIPLDSLI